MVNSMIQRGLAASESVFQVIDTPSEKDTGTHTSVRALGEIALQNVTLQYASDKPPALRELSLNISAGQTVALVGPSGGGKSSIAALISRFYEPTSGSISLDGVPLADWRLTNLREQIAYVSQEVVLFNDTVANNIAYGHRTEVPGALARERIVEAAKAAHAHTFIEQLPNGYDTPVGERGAALSGGQRQRIAIARALLKDAPVLILDEATAALDNESERAVQAALLTLMKGRTTVVIAHRLSTIEHADRIVVIENGEIKESGQHSELIANGGIYAKLHASSRH
jgi:ATP-binding cassette, subfamily B, bacterial MsbA